MLRHMVHAGIIVADFTSQVVTGDDGKGSWLMIVAVATFLFSAYGLARNCSAELFAPPSETV